MMALMGRLFGTEKALSQAVDGVVSGLDKLWYTEEEKAQAQAENRARAREMVVSWMQATSGQNLARRLLALSISATWLSMYLLSAALSLSAVWVNNRDKLMESAAIVADNAERLNGAVTLILAFYFAAPHMSDIISVSMAKFSKKN